LKESPGPRAAPPRRAFAALLAVTAAACARPDDALTIIGTSDLHGHLEGSPGKGGVALLGGYLANLRRDRAVVLVDGGDLFQGTLVSNFFEGAPVVRAMNALGYAASAIGNHEFDYGPAGPAAVARAPGEDPRGALRARARQAAFPLLGANIFDEATGGPVAWEHVVPGLLVARGGVKIGIVGGTTRSAPVTTNRLHLRGLRIERLQGPVRAQAEALRVGRSLRPRRPRRRRTHASRARRPHLSPAQDHCR
jgi:5'-nucleotidase